MLKKENETFKKEKKMLLSEISKYQFQRYHSMSKNFYTSSRSTQKSLVEKISNIIKNISKQ